MIRQKLGFDRLESRRLLAVDAVASECLLKSASRIDSPVPNDAVFQCRGEGTRSVLWQVPPGETSPPTALGECRGVAGGGRLVEVTYDTSITYVYEATCDNGDTIRWAVGFPAMPCRNAPVSGLPDRRSQDVATVEFSERPEDSAPSSVSESDEAVAPPPESEGTASANVPAEGVILVAEEDADEREPALQSGVDAAAAVREPAEEAAPRAADLPGYEALEEPANDDDVELPDDAGEGALAGNECRSFKRHVTPRHEDGDAASGLEREDEGLLTPTTR